MLFAAVISGNVYSQDYNFRNFNYRKMDWLNHMFIQLSRMIRVIYGLVQETDYQDIMDLYLKILQTVIHWLIILLLAGISDGEFIWFGHMNGWVSYFDGKKFNHRC